MSDYHFLAWMLAGFLGGGHCLGMCGGIVTAFTLQLPPGPRWPYLIGFNLGRLGGYTLVGLLAGFLGTLSHLLLLQYTQAVLWVLANSLLIAMGCYLAGWTRWLQGLEQLGVPVWRRIQPILGYFLPIRRRWHSLMVGLLWGWLPCGLVYTAALGAMAQGNAPGGALVMLAFGLGTLPNLLLIGASAQLLRRVAQQRWLRLLLAISLIALGIWQLCIMDDHGAHLNESHQHARNQKLEVRNQNHLI